MSDLHHLKDIKKHISYFCRECGTQDDYINAEDIKERLPKEYWENCTYGIPGNMPCTSEVNEDGSTPPCEGTMNMLRENATEIFYVNAYSIGQSYGGPEEGGWYYNVGIAVASIPVWATFRYKIRYQHGDGQFRVLEPTFDDVRVENFKRYLLKSEFAKDGSYYGDDSHAVADLEAHPAKTYPQRKPHYC